MEWIFLAIILIFSVVFHEVSHGVMANYLGDQTAKNEGRLTLNPLPHLDLMGSIILPALLILSKTGIIFGWAKPVPINPYNFRDQKYGEAKVAIVGPLANFSLALVFGLVIRFFSYSLDPSVIYFLTYIVYINIMLAVFNLVPIPPLDGSHILFTFLPESARSLKRFLSQYGFVILFIIIFFYFEWISIITQNLFILITGATL